MINPFRRLRANHCLATTCPPGGGRWQRIAALEQAIFTERHLRVYGASMAAAWALILGGVFSYGHWLSISEGRWRCLDFGRIWLSGRFARMGNTAQIYDYSIFSAAQTSLFGVGSCVLPFHFPYPPTSLFFTYPFALLPYPFAFALWIAVTLALYLTAAYAVVPRASTVILALTPFFVTANIILGQNGFLTAGLFGLVLVILERRPWTAGILLGLLSYKPQFGVLFPLALLASRNWRALGGAAVSTLFFAAAAAAAFGKQSWPLFFHSLFDRGAGLNQEPVETYLQSVYGLLHSAGANVWIAWTVHLLVAAAVTTVIYAVWVRPIAYPLKAALLCIGAVTVTPYVLPYDLCILAIAAAFLTRDALDRGFLVGERGAFLLCWAGVYFVSFRSGPILCGLLLLLVIRRIAHFRRIADRQNEGDWDLVKLSTAAAEGSR